MKKTISIEEKIERRSTVEKAMYAFLKSLEGIHENSIEFQWIKKSNNNISGVELTAKFEVFDNNYSIDIQPDGVADVFENGKPIGYIYWSACHGGHIIGWGSSKREPLDKVVAPTEYQDHILKKVEAFLWTVSNNKIVIKCNGTYGLDGKEIRWNMSTGVEYDGSAVVWRDAFGTLVCTQNVPDHVLNFIRRNCIYKGN